MDNRPSKIDTILTFREAGLSINMQFPEGYMVLSPSAFFLYGRMPIDANIQFVVNNNTLRIVIDKESIRNLPNTVDLYLSLEEKVILYQTIIPTMQGSVSAPGLYSISFNGEVAVSVFIPGYDIISPLVDRAEIALEGAESAIEEINVILNNFPEA